MTQKGFHHLTPNSFGCRRTPKRRCRKGNEKELMSSTAPNQEPAADRLASPPPPNPQLGKVSEFWVWILVRFFENARFCGLAPSAEITPKTHTKIRTSFATFNSVQTRCIVKGEAQKSPLCWQFLGAFDFLRIACSLGIPRENFKFNGNP